jgi:hypothetical protein
MKENNFFDVQFFPLKTPQYGLSLTNGTKMLRINCQIPIFEI